MKTVNTFKVLANLKKVFTRRMVGIDYTTRELYLQDGVSYDDAEQMLILIENLHDTVGFEDEEDAVAFYSIRATFYSHIDEETERIRELLTAAPSMARDEMDLLGLTSNASRKAFLSAVKTKEVK